MRPELLIVDYDDSLPFPLKVTQAVWLLTWVIQMLQPFRLILWFV